MRSKNILLGLCILFSFPHYARDYVVYAVTQEVPMGVENEIIHKNFYVNMGKEQGIYPGVVLSVLRTISLTDPYDPVKRYHHLVKVAELEVIHAEDQSAITNLKEFFRDAKSPQLDISGVIVGDVVQVSVKP